MTDVSPLKRQEIVDALRARAVCGRIGESRAELEAALTAVVELVVETAALSDGQAGILRETAAWLEKQRKASRPASMTVVVPVRGP